MIHWEINRKNLSFHHQPPFRVGLRECDCFPFHQPIYCLILRARLQPSYYFYSYCDRSKSSSYFYVSDLFLFDQFVLRSPNSTTLDSTISYSTSFPSTYCSSHDHGFPPIHLVSNCAFYHLFLNYSYRFSSLVVAKNHTCHCASTNYLIDHTEKNHPFGSIHCYRSFYYYYCCSRENYYYYYYFRSCCYYYCIDRFASKLSALPTFNSYTYSTKILCQKLWPLSHPMHDQTQLFNTINQIVHRILPSTLRDGNRARIQCSFPYMEFLSSILLRDFHLES